MTETSAAFKRTTIFLLPVFFLLLLIRLWFLWATGVAVMTTHGQYGFSNGFDAISEEITIWRHRINTKHTYTWEKFCSIRTRKIIGDTWLLYILHFVVANVANYPPFSAAVLLSRREVDKSQKKEAHLLFLNYAAASF